MTDKTSDNSWLSQHHNKVVAIGGASSQPKTHIFELDRPLHYQGDTTLEKHTLISNPDPASHVKALLISLHGKDFIGHDASFSIYALGSTPVQSMHLIDKGIILPSHFTRRGNTQYSPFVEGLNPPDPKSFDALHRPDIQAGILSGLDTFSNKTDARTLEIVCLLNLRSVSAQVSMANHNPELASVMALSHYVNATHGEVVNNETKSLFDDLSASQVFSKNDRINRAVITQMASFLQENYKPVALDVMPKFNAKISNIATHPKADDISPA